MSSSSPPTKTGVPPPGVVATPSTVRTEEDLSEMVDFYAGLDAFAFDLETKEHDGPATNPRYNRITWLSFAGPGRSDAVPVAHEHGEVDVPRHVEKYEEPDPAGGVYKSGPRKGTPRMKKRSRTIPDSYHEPPIQLDIGVVIQAIRPLFFSDQVKVAHNAKFDLATLGKYFREPVRRPIADTIVLHHLLNENLRTYKLGELVRELYGVSYPKIGGETPHLQPFSAAARYAHQDAVWCWLLYEEFIEGLSAQGLSAVWHLEMDLVFALADMEWEGAPVDLTRLKGLGDELERKMVGIQSSVWKDAGRKLNLNANADKAWYAYEHRGNPVKVFTDKKREPSTTAAALEEIAAKDAYVQLLLDYATLSKLRGTYVDGMADHVVHGRIHASFVATGARTGRFSCRDPNLQNIPRVTDDPDDTGRLIRGLFAAPPGYVVVVADYDQIEYRLLAHISEDPKMIAAFNDGVDPHAAIAASVLGKDVADITPDERSMGKTINFAVLYGSGADTMAASAGVSATKARQFLKRFWAEYPTVEEWKKRLLDEARRQRPPHVTTMFGRRRRLPALFYSDNELRAEAERQAVNSVVQGTAADLIKMAMVKFHRASEGTPHRLVLTVHDELVVYSPEDIADEGCAMLEEAMVGDQFLSVPLAAKASFAPNWGEAK